MSIFRRIFLASVCGVLACSLFVFQAHADSEPLKVSMLIPGQIDDGGFMEAGYNGLIASQVEFGVDTRYIANVVPRKAELMGALQQLAGDQPDMIIALGGQNSEAVEVIAADYPDVRFVVIQGNVTGANLSSYEVLQEESAWLAGAAAGLLTKSNIVGHISGIRVVPGLKGRGAFYNGLKHTNPDAEFLTSFSGDQDDKSLAKKVAKAEIDAGADIIFTMLNAARDGATEAMRESGVRQIGNVRDWIADDPEVFIGSAVADVSKAVVSATNDLANGNWKAGEIIQIGLDEPSAVSLTLSDDVSSGIRKTLEELRLAIVSGEINVSVAYEGGEFAAP